MLDVPVGDNIVAGGAAVTFWETTEEGTARNCRDFDRHRTDGFGSRIETAARFAFATEETTRSLQTRCVPTR